APDQILLAVTGQLEDVAAGREHARVLVADDEAGVRRGVGILEQLEQEPEPAAVAGDGLAGQPFHPVVVDRAVLAVRADEVRDAETVAPALSAAAGDPGRCGGRACVGAGASAAHARSSPSHERSRAARRWSRGSAPSSTSSRSPRRAPGY